MGNKQPTTSATCIIKIRPFLGQLSLQLSYYKYDSTQLLSVEHNNVILLNDSAEGLIISWSRAPDVILHLIHDHMLKVIICAATNWNVS